MGKSEFGKGLTICLVKFAEHCMTLRHEIELYKDMRVKHPNLFSEGDAVSIWANGASDHLYDIEVPEGKDWNSIRKNVKELQELGLDMGHGAGLMGEEEFTKADAEKLFDLTRKIALQIDRKLGLKPDIGSW